MSAEKRLGFLPGWRVFTYVILGFNVLMLVWVIAGAAQAQGTPSDCGSLSAKICNEAADTGTAIGVGIVIALWAFGDMILGVLWLVTNRKGRDCPVCGRGVKRGMIQCKSCGHDFRATGHAAPQAGWAAPPPAAPQAGWAPAAFPPPTAGFAPSPQPMGQVYLPPGYPAPAPSAGMTPPPQR
jgi:hypothetical protein